MRKKLIFIFAGLIVLIIAGTTGLNYLRSFQQVTVTTKQNGLSALIETKNGTKTGQTINGTQTFKLKKGDYRAVPQGDRFDVSPIAFSVGDQPVRLEIDPGYSKAYLSQLLTTDQPAISSTIQTAYSAPLRNFTRNPGQLYLYGEWYGTTLVENAEPGNNGDVYRMVLHKVDGQWTIAAKPALVLSARDHTDIPKSILDNLNDQSGY